MAESSEWRRNLRVLRNKRDATRYQILVEIAERQPAVNQSEIAESLGVTPQAVSEYLNDLVEKEHVRKLGRGRWEITPEGVDWLISQTDDLREFTRYVWEEVIEQGDIETAIATERIEEGDRVTVSMTDGLLHAHPGETGPATATAVTTADAGEDIGVSDFAGLLDFEVGTVTIIAVPPVQDGGSRVLDSSSLRDQAAEHDVIATAGPEAVAGVQAAGLSPDMRFGTPNAVEEAAVKGLNVLLVAVSTVLSRHTDRLREYEIPYKVVEYHR